MVENKEIDFVQMGRVCVLCWGDQGTDRGVKGPRFNEHIYRFPKMNVIIYGRVVPTI